MYKPIRFFLLSCTFLFAGYGYAQNFGGNPSSVKWNQVNTPSVRVIFPRGLDSQANRIANVVKLLGDKTAGTIGGKQRKWNIVLQTQTTISNAYVRMAPVMSEFYMTPDPNNFSNGSLRWDDNLVIHEDRHIQQLSNFNKGFTRVFSFFLGQEGQLLANGITIPDYFFEGDAVWQETLVSAQGRGRMPSFYNGFKSLWLDKRAYSWMKLRSGSYKDYTPDHYQLGYLLTAYGYEKYGEDFWRKVTEDAVRFRGLFYPFNQAIQRYSGRSYRQFREDALAYFRDKAFGGQVIASPAMDYLTPATKNNVTDYRFPAFISDDSILVLKNSYRDIPGFYILSKGKETRLRVRDIATDDYFSYRNGRIVYTAYQSDVRWTNRNYSVIRLYDIHTGEQRQVTTRSVFFSPDINESGTEVLAVQVKPDGTNRICRIDASTGNILKEVPNPRNYFFTQTKYLDAQTAITAARNPQGNMVLMKINLEDGTMDNITPFSFNVMGYPLVKGDTVYFSAMQGNADKIFAVTIKSNKLFKLTNNVNGVYHPAVNAKAEMVVSAFTSSGHRLARYRPEDLAWKPVAPVEFVVGNVQYYADSMLTIPGAGALYGLRDQRFEDTETGRAQHKVTKYRKSFRLFNFHSWRPVVDDPEFGYALYSDNVLSSFSNSVSYTYNRSDRSHTLGFSGVYAGWFPLVSLAAEESFNRTVDTAVGKSVQYNSAKLSAGISVPLQFINGRTSKFFHFGVGYNLEQYFYRGVGKNVFSNNAIKYISGFLNFSNTSQRAKQHINPRWAQTLSLSYRDAVNFSNSHKFVAHGSLYFPGLFVNHSLVINTAWQKRDTLPDLFSKNFSYARGYEALSTRRMYKFGVNYHFPIVYPDWGFGNIIFFQRIRTNLFYDYSSARARLNGVLTEIKSRSTGAELYFDTKAWNALPVNFGVRYSYLLDTDLLNRGVRNRWELIIPIGLIPD